MPELQQEISSEKGTSFGQIMSQASEMSELLIDGDYTDIFVAQFVDYFVSLSDLPQKHHFIESLKKYLSLNGYYGLFDLGMKDAIVLAAKNHPGYTEENRSELFNALVDMNLDTSCLVNNQRPSDIVKDKLIAQFVGQYSSLSDANQRKQFVEELHEVLDRKNKTRLFRPSIKAVFASIIARDRAYTLDEKESLITALHKNSPTFLSRLIQRLRECGDVGARRAPGYQ